ncbi:hypothetical protein M3Y95_00272900 [Aphelenchoides besseyi]|nr:hypothetical protein M3Y95_00272900 [Aphelenchoides besseyi]
MHTIVVFLLFSTMIVVVTGAGSGMGAPTSTCKDKLRSCARSKPYCTSPKLQRSLSINCKFTCGLCGSGGGSSSGSSGQSGSQPSRRSPLTNTNSKCKDRNSACAYWNRSGFCRSRLYTRFVKKQACGKTCNLCNA